MAEQVRKQRVRKSEDTEQASDAPAAKHKTGEELKAEMDDLLDDIEAVLDENENLALEYRQLGGE